VRDSLSRVLGEIVGDEGPCGDAVAGPELVLAGEPGRSFHPFAQTLLRRDRELAREDTLGLHVLFDLISLADPLTQTLDHLIHRILANEGADELGVAGQDHDDPAEHADESCEEHCDYAQQLPGYAILVGETDETVARPDNESQQDEDGANLGLHSLLLRSSLIHGSSLPMAGFAQSDDSGWKLNIL